MRTPDPQHPFPARVPPLPGESLASLVRRTAQAMGYESVARVVGLLSERGQLPPHLNQLAAGRVFHYLAALLRLSPDAISALTVHAYATSLVPDAPEMGSLPRRVIPRRSCAISPSSWPVCPTCLAQDEVPYERLVWSFRPVPMCVKHGCVLVSRCPACQRPLRWDRLDVSRCHCGERLGDVEPVAVSPQALSLCRNVDGALRSELQLLA